MGDIPAPDMILCPICGNDKAKRLDLDSGDSLLYRCLDCRVVHRDNVWKLEKAVEHYHDYYKGKSPEYDPITEKRYHTILDWVEQHKVPGPLLDVGCGMGHFLTVAESRGWQPVGLELSVSGLQFLTSLKAKGGWQFQVWGKDLLTADLPEGSFRAVTLFEVLEHLIDPMANLRKIHTLLEPGGLLYLTTPNFDSLSRYALGSRWRVITPEHLNLFNLRAIRTCLEAAGFRPIRVLTKNVDVPEILAKWRRGRQAQGHVNTFPATRAFRRTIEDSRYLRLLKGGVNAALWLLSLGETVEALAVK